MRFMPRVPVSCKSCTPFHARLLVGVGNWDAVNIAEVNWKGLGAVLSVGRFLGIIGRNLSVFKSDRFHVVIFQLLGIIGRNPSVSKSNRLCVVIFRFFGKVLRHINWLKS
jgi:hypothetical protein